MRIYLTEGAAVGREVEHHGEVHVAADFAQAEPHLESQRVIHTAMSYDTYSYVIRHIQLRHTTQMLS